MGEIVGATEEIGGDTAAGDRATIATEIMAVEEAPAIRVEVEATIANKSTEEEEAPAKVEANDHDISMLLESRI